MNFLVTWLEETCFMKYRYLIRSILIVVMMSLTGCFIFPPVNNIDERTLMVYLDSDNNLERAGIEDINEMEMVGTTQDVNILVQMDRIPYSILASNNEGYIDDASNGNWTTTRRYLITKDNDPFQINSQLINDLGELNMGEPQTLIDFVNWSISNYPAKKYLLIIWNHGGGFRSTTLELSRDIAWDDTSGGDKINMPEMESALSAISMQLGKEIAIVGMDACFMAMAEVAYQIKDHADILVSSEESEPSDGWPYDIILSELVGNPAISAQEFSENIVDNYIFSYPGSNVTQSAIDLSYMDVLAAQISNLSLAIMNDSHTPKNKYITSSLNTQYYIDNDFIDLHDFCSNLLMNSYSNDVKSIASSIQNTLNNAVLKSGYNGPGLSDSNGISIYFPYLYYHYYYDNTNFSKDTFWDEMLLHLGF